MKRSHSVSLFSVVFLLNVSATSSAKAEPSEASLVQAWETIQKNDPKTEIFKQTSEHHYQFKNSQIPYEGELIFMNAYVETTGDRTIGVVEVRLPALKMRDTGNDADLGRGFGFARWTRNNYLVYDEKSQRWITSDEDTKQRLHKATSPTYAFLSFLSGWGLSVLCLALVFYSVVRGRRVANKSFSFIERSQQMTERVIALNEQLLEQHKQTNTLLAELKDLLKSK